MRSEKDAARFQPQQSVTHISPIKQRLRIVFGKFGALKYTGHLDTAKLWERVLRRVNLPILYTRGFNARPRIQLASALPLGITSECEILDVVLKERIKLDNLIERLLAVSPAGLKIYSIREVPAGSPALQTLVRGAEYRICFEDGVDSGLLQARINAILSAESIIEVREKRGKKGKLRKTTVDLRPLIHDLRIDEQGNLIAHLTVGDRGNIRPSRVLQEMGLDDTYHSIHRFRLHLDSTT